MSTKDRESLGLSICGAYMNGFCHYVGNQLNQLNLNDMILTNTTVFTPNHVVCLRPSKFLFWILWAVRRHWYTFRILQGFHTAVMQVCHGFQSFRAISETLISKNPLGVWRPNNLELILSKIRCVTTNPFVTHGVVGILSRHVARKSTKPVDGPAAAAWDKLHDVLLKKTSPWAAYIYSI